MCLSPIAIDNPYRVHKQYFRTVETADKSSVVKVAINKISDDKIYVNNKPFASFGYDTESLKIYVPCGRCPVCCALRQSYLVQRVQMMSLDYYIYFATLTYNNESLPFVKVNGKKIKYADVQDFQNCIRYIRKWCNLPDFKYLACSEFGSKRHRPHWHCLFFFPKSYFQNDFSIKARLLSFGATFSRLLLKYWRHNIGSRKEPVWVQNTTFKQIGIKRNFDFQLVDTISKDSDDVTYYVTKYCCKFDDYVDRLRGALWHNLPKESFKEIWRTVKPKFLLSKGFGIPKHPDVKAYINKCIKRSINETSYPYPCYFDINNGKSFPLSPYYRSRFLTCDDSLVFRKRQLALSPTGVLGDKEFDYSPDLIDFKFSRFEKVKKQIRSRDVDLSLLFDEDSNDISDFLSSVSPLDHIDLGDFGNSFDDFENDV